MHDPARSRIFSLDVGSHTEVGRVRDHNEDSLRVSCGLGLFVVADGMGGHSAGERASFLAVEELIRYLRSLSHPASPDELEAAFRSANAAIFQESMEVPERRGMGTTMTALTLDGETYRIGHVGDSRAWLLRSGSCRQLTQDHSVMGEQLRRGLITREQAERHPLRNVLTRSLGNLPEVEVDVLRGSVFAGDVFILGTDGMTRVLDERAIATRLGRAATPQAGARDLVDYACREDGSDNVTAVVVRCDLE